jgi:hypothetical protein
MTHVHNLGIVHIHASGMGYTDADLVRLGIRRKGRFSSLLDQTSPDLLRRGTRHLDGKRRAEDGVNDK